MKSRKTQELYCQESFRSHMAACMALAAFRRRVQEKCRSVMERHKNDLAAALGLKPSVLRLQPYPSPGELAKVDSDRDIVELGIKVKYQEAFEFNGNVWWAAERMRREEDGWKKDPHGVQVWVWSKQKSDTETLRDALERIADSRWQLGYNRTLYRWNEIPLSRMPQFEKDLDALVSDTIKVIRRSGAFRKRKPKAK